MDCEKIERHILEFVDCQLREKDHLTLSVHLNRCQDCQMKMEDLLRLRASIQFSKALDPAPVADENFARSVVEHLGEAVPVTGTTLWEKIESVLMPLRFRWLAPAIALIFLLIVPLSIFKEQNKGINIEQPVAYNTVKNKVLHPVHQKEQPSELDEYLMFHSKNASESHISYPMVYASY